jgi:hypothetical protein
MTQVINVYKGSLVENYNEKKKNDELKLIELNKSRCNELIEFFKNINEQLTPENPMKVKSPYPWLLTPEWILVCKKISIKFKLHFSFHNNDIIIAKIVFDDKKKKQADYLCKSLFKKIVEKINNEQNNLDISSKDDLSLIFNWNHWHTFQIPTEMFPFNIVSQKLKNQYSYVLNHNFDGEINHLSWVPTIFKPIRDILEKMKLNKNGVKRKLTLQQRKVFMNSRDEYCDFLLRNPDINISHDGKYLILSHNDKSIITYQTDECNFN